MRIGACGAPAPLGDCRTGVGTGPRTQRISAVQSELLLLWEIGITGLRFAIHPGMVGWLWQPLSPGVSGAETTLTKEGASRGDEKKGSGEAARMHLCADSGFHCSSHFPLLSEL